MRSRADNEKGETLIEVLISIIVIGIVLSAFFAAISTTSKATTSQRNVVKADAVLRDYAETAKQAARDTCTPGNAGTAFSVTLSPPAPNGYTVSGTNQTCPAPDAVRQVTITATLPNGVQKQLTILVRTP